MNATVFFLKKAFIFQESQIYILSRLKKYIFLKIYRNFKTIYSASTLIMTVYILNLLNLK